MKNMMIAVMYLVVMLSAPSVWAGENTGTDTVYKGYEEAFSQCNVFLGEGVMASDENCALGWLPEERGRSKKKGGTRWWLKMFDEHGSQVNLHLTLDPKCLYQLDARGKWHECSSLIDSEGKIVLKGHHKGFGFKLEIEEIPNVRRYYWNNWTYIFSGYWYYG